MIALISDVHGNYEALKSVMDEIDNLGISDIFCLGDIVGYYSQVNEVCEELRKRNIKCVLGNHDWYLVSGTKCSRSRSVNDCLDYQRTIITDENLSWIRDFPVCINAYSVNMVHGGWVDPIDEYIEAPGDHYFEKIDGLFFASGHTHIQGIYELNGKIYCNPGSVGQPRDGDNRAAYALFDGKTFTLKRVQYDFEKVGKLMDDAGFEPYYYGCLRDGSRHLHK